MNDEVPYIRMNDIGVPTNGHCFICYEPSTIWEFNSTICVRCSKLWKSGYGRTVTEIREELRIE